MEGFLPWLWCLIWWIIALPCLIFGLYQLKKVLAADRDALPLLGVSGGFIFILSSLKLPFMTGSMISRVQKRVEAYYLESGASIPVCLFETEPPKPDRQHPVGAP